MMATAETWLSPRGRWPEVTEFSSQSVQVCINFVNFWQHNIKYCKLQIFIERSIIENVMLNCSNTVHMVTKTRVEMVYFVRIYKLGRGRIT